MTAWSTWEKILELGEPVYENDWSNFLFKKLDELFVEIEDYQNNPDYQSIQASILEMIERCKIKNIL
jgi:flagellar hook-associated protein FlgK